MRRIYIIVLLLLLIIGNFFISPPKAEANFIDDAIGFVKKIFTGEKNVDQVISLESNITLAPNGDEDNNSQIDTGDTVKFEYIIDNKTDNDYSWLILNTKINRKSINSLHNTFGIINLNENDNTIVIPNIRVPAKQKISLSFEAKVNFSTKKDLIVSTEPILLDASKKSMVNSSKKQIVAKKISPEKLSKITDKFSGFKINP